MNRLIATMAGAAILSGCATQYQSIGLTGGHMDQAGPGKLHQVVFAANGYTSTALTEKYALYRSAEIAQSLNKPYFIMYESLTSAAIGLPSDTPRMGIVQNKPIATAFILPLDASAPGAHDTRATLDELRNVIANGRLDQPDSAKK